jgi:hypothetical protein
MQKRQIGGEVDRLRFGHMYSAERMLEAEA